MATLAQVFEDDPRIEQCEKFERQLLTFVADLLQPDFNTPRKELQRSARLLLAAWSEYVDRDLSEDLEFALKMRDYRDLQNEVADGSHSMRL